MGNLQLDSPVSSKKQERDDERRKQCINRSLEDCASATLTACKQNQQRGAETSVGNVPTEVLDQAASGPEPEETADRFATRS